MSRHRQLFQQLGEKSLQICGYSIAGLPRIRVRLTGQ
jgi:hypothetical protein